MSQLPSHISLPPMGNQSSSRPVLPSHISVGRSGRPSGSVAPSQHQSGSMPPPNLAKQWPGVKFGGGNPLHNPRRGVDGIERLSASSKLIRPYLFENETLQDHYVASFTFAADKTSLPIPGQGFRIIRPDPVKLGQYACCNHEFSKPFSDEPGINADPKMSPYEIPYPELKYCGLNDEETLAQAKREQG